LRKGGALEKLRIEGVPIVEWVSLFPTVSFTEKKISLKEAFSLVVDVEQKVAHAVAYAKERKLFPVVLGGDHSIAVGTWNGIAKKLQGPLGMIWIDAHMDAHTPETTPSGAWHGMPLAALMGYGDPQMTELLRKEPILLPQHVCLIGVRSFEAGEAALLKRLNVRVYEVAEVKKRGFAAVLEEAIAHVTQGTKGYGVSFDLDVIDPSEVPGVGSPEEHGLGSKEIIAALPKLKSDPRLQGFELVEYNPERDVNDKTFHVCCHLLQAALYQGSKHE
jgi:arginase